MGKAIDYTAYYKAQAGGQIDRNYVSYRYQPNQRGNGFFGRLIKGTIWPLIKGVMPYLKERTLEGVGTIVEDLKAGKSFKESGKAVLKDTAKKMFSDATRDFSTRFQSGSGVKGKRSRRRKAKRVARKAKPKKPRRKTKAKAKTKKPKKGRKRIGKPLFKL